MIKQEVPWRFLKTCDAQRIGGTDHYQCRLDLVAKDGSETSVNVLITTDDFACTTSVVETLIGSVGRPCRVHAEGAKLIGFTWLDGAKCL